MVTASAARNDRLVQALAAGVDRPLAREQGLTRPGKPLDAVGNVDHCAADNHDGQANLLETFCPRKTKPSFRQNLQSAGRPRERDDGRERCTQALHHVSENAQKDSTKN
jgi:hypothetical protein